MITNVSEALSANEVPHSMADHTLAIFVHGGAIVVRETEYGNVAVIYPAGQYVAFSADDAVNHVLWLLSDEFEAITPEGTVYHLPASKRVFAPFLVALVTGLLATFAPLMAVAWL
jgi:hypothetical protein